MRPSLKPDCIDKGFPPTNPASEGGLMRYVRFLWEWPNLFHARFVCDWLHFLRRGGGYGRLALLSLEVYRYADGDWNVQVIFLGFGFYVETRSPANWQ